jgi:polyribonucleotide nucleotidyltransferase
MDYYRNHKIKSLDFNGKIYTFDFGKFATLTNSSCIVSCGGTSVLVTTVMSEDEKDCDFLPLMVNYQEKFYATGKLYGSRFQRRESRPSNSKILTGRIIDRSLRPLFPTYLRNEVQVMATILSFDGENDHDICAALGASASLTISNIPWEGPLSSIRIGMIDNKLLINPSIQDQKKSDLDLFVSSTQNNVVMIDAGSNEILEEIMLEAINLAKTEGKKICDFFESLQKEFGKEKKIIINPEKDEEIYNWVLKNFEKDFTECLWGISEKQKRMQRKNEIFKNIEQEALKKFENEERINLHIKKSSALAWKKILRNAILNEEKRIAERKLDEIRPLNIEIDLFERLHGSALFQRGETQCLSIATLGAPSDKLHIEGIDGIEEKQYFHHYNFPPFSVGSTSYRLATGNREIGHGSLAEKALIPVLPKEENFPYTIRVVSEILMSNGSSSMAATCGSTLALMSAGVPISSPVGGIAMGLILSEDGKNYKILSDIQDDEDFVGDMDFKVTGTKKGITAIQMDIKVLGLSGEIFVDALKQAKKGRIEIIEKMLKIIDKPKSNLSKYAPKLHTFTIKESQIKVLIGKGGETIQKIIKDTGVTIDIKDDGIVTIASENDEQLLASLKMIKEVLFEPVVGEVYEAIVRKVESFGAFVDIAPKVSGLVHVSKIANERVENVSSILSVGQKVKVKLLEIDNKGRLNLSIKDVDK